jgi:urea carboxylase
MCIYGMEGPGGYQFVGRTVQIWNRYRSTDSFKPGKPWLLRFFDQIKYYPVTTQELEKLRRDMPQGRFDPLIEETSFSLRDYEAFLAENADSIRRFKTQQQEAFDAERARWDAAGLSAYIDEPVDAPESAGELPGGAEPVESPVAGSVWKVLRGAEAASVEAGETLAVLESMKMEIEVVAPKSGTLVHVACEAGQSVAPGQVLFGVKPPEA